MNKLVIATIEQLQRLETHKSVVAQDGELVARQIEPLQVGQRGEGTAAQVGQIIRAQHERLKYQCRCMLSVLVN